MEGKISSKEPVVSVIIPVYQRASTISKAILSITNQDYKKLEVIVVDDHSSDSTPELVYDLQKQDPRIKYIQLQSNVGPAGARNAGVAIARGRFLAFLDSDDEWLPGKLENQVILLDENPSCGVVFTDCRLVNRQTGKSQRLSDINGYFKKDLSLIPVAEGSSYYRLSGPLQESLFKKFFIVISSVLMRKSDFDMVNGFDPGRFGTEDIDFFVRMAPHTEFIFWDQEMVVKYIDPTSISEGNDRWLREHINYFKSCLTAQAYEGLQSLTLRNLKRFYKHLIILYTQKRKPLKAFGIFFESLHYSFSPELLMFTLLSVLGNLPYRIRAILK